MNFSDFQKAVIAEIRELPSFQLWVGIDHETPETMNEPSRTVGPFTFMWFDTMGCLNTWRVSTTEVEYKTSPGAKCGELNQIIDLDDEYMFEQLEESN